MTAKVDNGKDKNEIQGFFAALRMTAKTGSGNGNGNRNRNGNGNRNRNGNGNRNCNGSDNRNDNRNSNGNRNGPIRLRSRQASLLRDGRSDRPALRSR